MIIKVFHRGFSRHRHRVLHYSKDRVVPLSNEELYADANFLFPLKMIIYIRHTNDEVTDPTHRHDHGVTDDGLRKAKRKARFLIKKYGRPETVFYSPFKRSVETMKAMVSQMGKHPVMVYRDPHLSRYFSKKEKRDPSIAPETKEAHPPIQETWKRFERRVDRHLMKMVQDGYFDPGRVIW